MSNAGELPNTLAVNVILWGFAFPCLWYSTELILQGELFQQFPRIVIGYVLGIGSAWGALAALGYITPQFGGSVTRWLQPIASDPRWAIAIWFIIFCWLAGPRFVGRMRTAWRKGGFRPRVVYDQFKDEYNPPNGLLYTHLWFRNAGGDAWEVEPHITWTPKGKNQVLFDGTAKWKETPWNAGRGIYARNRIPIPNDGKPHLLDLCVRKPAAADFYWLDIESARGGDPFAQIGYFKREFTMSTLTLLVTGMLRISGLRYK